MNGSDITSLLKHLPIFAKVISSDQIPQKPKKKIYVVNSDSSSDPGSHWLAVDYTGKKPMFFDSFGNPPSYYNFPKMNHSPLILQSPSAETCGIYVIYYIYSRANKQSLSTMMRPFSSNKKKNDAYIINWLTKYKG